MKKQLCLFISLMVILTIFNVGNFSIIHAEESSDPNPVEENTDSTDFNEIEQTEQERYNQYVNGEDIKEEETSKFSVSRSTAIPYWSPDVKGNRKFHDANGTVFGNTTSCRVIDVSQWQGTIDWNKVKSSGKVDAVIIRIGFAWDGVDTQAKRNISECNRLKIPYGVYLFSYANTSSEATKEAQYTYNLLKSYGAKLSLPVYYDLEAWAYTNGAEKSPSTTSTYVNMVNNYVSYLSGKGYKTNVYSYRSMLNGVLKSSSIWKYVSWMAAYTQTYGWSNPYYSGITGWQYTSTASVSGIKGNVDVSSFYNLNVVDTQNTVGKSTGKASTEPTIYYRANSKSVGWLDYVNEPNTAGTTGRNLPLYQLQIKEKNESKSFNLSAKVYIKYKGWVSYSDIESEDIIGSNGYPMRIVNFNLKDQKGYRLQYRVHSANVGWTSWVNEGTNSGSSANDIQAIEFRLVRASAIDYDTKALYYRSHLSNIGWMEYKSAGTTSGKSGSGEKLEAFSIGFLNSTTPKISAKLNIDQDGWTEFDDVTGNTILGTTGEGKAIHAFVLNSKYGDGVILKYRAYITGSGWTSWVNEGTQIGTEDSSLLEAIQIKYVNEYNISNIKINSSISLEETKSTKLTTTLTPSNTTDSKTVSYKSSNTSVASVDSTGTVSAKSIGTANITATSSNGKTSTCKVTVTKLTPKVHYRVHQQDYGWKSTVSNGLTSGTYGKGKQIEALKLSLSDVESTANVKVRLYLQDKGWKTYTVAANNSLTLGTTGQNKRVIALSMSLNNVDGYKIAYRAYIRGIGWSNWTDQGNVLGTVGLSYKIEAIQIKLVNDSITYNPTIRYRTHVQNKGWLKYVANSTTSGYPGKGNRVEATRLMLENVPTNAYLSGKVYVQTYGWKSYSKISASTSLGTVGKGKRIEAINLKLNNCPGYKLQYAAYIQGKGWSGWINQGSTLGASKSGRRIEGLKYRIVKE